MMYTEAKARATHPFLPNDIFGIVVYVFVICVLPEGFTICIDGLVIGRDWEAELNISSQC